VRAADLFVTLFAAPAFAQSSFPPQPSGQINLSDWRWQAA
jgi:hypothetical protein